MVGVGWGGGFLEVRGQGLGVWSWFLSQFEGVPCGAGVGEPGLGQEGPPGGPGAPIWRVWGALRLPKGQYRRSRRGNGP